MLRDLYEARRRRRFREEVGNLVISASLAAMAGAVVGILFAPKSGEETRAELVEGTKEMAENVKHGARDLADEVYIRGLEAKKTARDTVDKIAYKTEKVLSDVTEAGEDIYAEAQYRTHKLASDVKDKAGEVKEATEDLIDDLGDKTEEVKEDVLKFGRDINETPEMADAKTPADLDYLVCEPSDLECKIPEDKSKDK
ncbi:MAG: YtxH domain-containing protein [Tissierellia bacterium]|nr:YtxH domain-containing protein [Tissierellia bacterium]